MIPSMALKKHVWLGAGLIWKRIHASCTTNRLEEEEAEREAESRRRETGLWKESPRALRPLEAV